MSFSDANFCNSSPAFRLTHPVRSLFVDVAVVCDTLMRTHRRVTESAVLHDWFLTGSFLEFLVSGYGFAVNPVKRLYSEALSMISFAMFRIVLAETYSPKVRLNVEKTVSTIQRCP
jgi:hypothetical protein